jgi:sterol 24-C-methyltransferase
MWATCEERRQHYREMVPLVFDATAEAYYAHWGEFFHLAIFAPDDDPDDFEGALERTHQRYFEAIGGCEATRILEVATGGGAFAEWMADRTPGEVVGVDLSAVQLERARARLQGRSRSNLRLVRHDVMQIADLDEPMFDAAVCLDAACYFPEKDAALQGITTRLRSGAKFLLVDWCRAERPSGLQEEMVLEPFYRYWGIPELETSCRYQMAFRDAGLRLLQVEDLSEHVRPNWERGYRAAQRALENPPTPMQLLQITARALHHGAEAIRILKEQFYAALFAKVAADAGLLRYTLFLAERK